METLSSIPFTGRPPIRPPANADASVQRLALDNLIRRELKVGDPNDPAQVAQALLARYQDDPRAKAIKQEAQGLPFLQTQATSVVPAPASPSSSDTEWQQALSDVDRDLNELVTNSLLKDLTPELQGWSQAVRSAITQGGNAARFAIDPSQRDRAFASRRLLGDYARLARFIGVLNPQVNMYYRSFAGSVDECSSSMLVRMGEALANLGFEAGRYLLQVPYTEMQMRREALILALRNFTGSTQEAYGPNEWPRGIDAYRRLYNDLESQGQGDLRVLLDENELARMTNELIQRGSANDASGLRAVGATAPVELEPFHRMVAFGRHMSPASPEMTAYIEMIGLVADSFKPAGGSRLLQIARPPILFYGLYGESSTGRDDFRLTELVIERGRLAADLDYLSSSYYYDRDAVLRQILLDKVLYDVDRAIDLYAVGEGPHSGPEQRARAYGYVARAVLDLRVKTNFGMSEALKTRLTRIHELLAERGMGEPHSERVRRERAEVCRRELSIQFDCEMRWQDLVRTMAPNVIPVHELLGEHGIVGQLIRWAIELAMGEVHVHDPIERDEPAPLPPNYEVSLERIVRELQEKLPPHDDGAGGDALIRSI
jgi:hypothetical protein